MNTCKLFLDKIKKNTLKVIEYKGKKIRSMS